VERISRERGIEGIIIYILSLIAFIGVIDTSFLISIISPYSYSLGASKFEAGLIAGLYSIVAIPASIFAGLMMDRIGRWRMLRLGLFLDFVSMLLYHLAASPAMLMMTRVVHAIGGSMLFPSGISLVARYSRDEKIAPGISLFLIFIAISVAAGAVTSATIVTLFGFRLVFLLLAGIILLGGVLTLLLPSFLDIPEVSRRSINIGLVKVFGNRVVASVAMIFSLYIAFGFIVGGYPTLLVDLLGLPEERVSGLMGMYMGVATLVSIPVMFLTGRILSSGRERLVAMLGGSLLVASTYILMASPEPQGLFTSSLILGGAIGFLMVGSTYLAVTVDDSIRGVTTGIQQTFNILGIAIGAPVSGLLADVLGLGMMWIPLVTGLAMTLLVPLILGGGLDRGVEGL